MRKNKDYHWICTDCNKEFRVRSELLQHRKLYHSRYDENGNKLPWNKGLTAETSPSIAAAKANLRKTIEAGNFHAYWKGKKIPKEMIAKQSATRIKNGKSGGYHMHGGRGIRGWYKGFWCDSSWELAWIIYSLEHNLKFLRCKEKFEYVYEGKKHTYNPDFILENGEYVEIKGWSCNKWKAKVEQFPKGKILHILMKEQMLPILKYVEAKYGKDFVKMYDAGLV